MLNQSHINLKKFFPFFKPRQFAIWFDRRKQCVLIEQLPQRVDLLEIQFGVIQVTLLECKIRLNNNME